MSNSDLCGVLFSGSLPCLPRAPLLPGPCESRDLEQESIDGRLAPAVFSSKEAGNCQNA